MIKQKYEETLRSRKSADIVEHLPTLKKYATGCESVIELGVRYIVSTWALLSGYPDWMISVDMDNPGKYGADISEVYKLADAEGISFKFILGDDLKMELPEADLLFIDTLHTYAQLSQELKLHGNKAKKCIILHDTTKFGEVGEDKGPGLNKAVREFIKENKNWTVGEVFTNCNGLTILKRING